MNSKKINVTIDSSNWDRSSESAYITIKKHRCRLLFFYKKWSWSGKITSESSKLIEEIAKINGSYDISTSDLATIRKASKLGYRFS